MTTTASNVDHAAAEWLHEQGMSKADVARAMGVSRPTISYWVNPKGKCADCAGPTSAKTARLCLACRHAEQRRRGRHLEAERPKS